MNEWQWGIRVWNPSGMQQKSDDDFSLPLPLSVRHFFELSAGIWASRGEACGQKENSVDQVTRSEEKKPLEMPSAFHELGFKVAEPHPQLLLTSDAKAFWSEGKRGRLFFENMQPHFFPIQAGIWRDSFGTCYAPASREFSHFFTKRSTCDSLERWVPCFSKQSSTEETVMLI